MLTGMLAESSTSMQADRFVVWTLAGLLNTHDARPYLATEGLSAIIVTVALVLLFTRGGTVTELIDKLVRAITVNLPGFSTMFVCVCSTSDGLEDLYVVQLLTLQMPAASVVTFIENNLVVPDSMPAVVPILSGP